MLDLLRSDQFIKKIEVARVLGTEKSSSHKCYTYSGSAQRQMLSPSAEVDAGGQGTEVAFFQPDDDCGSDPSISDPSQRELLYTRSVREFQASWPLMLLFLPDLDTQLCSLSIIKPLHP